MINDVICRCEEVDRETITTALREGARDLDAIKKRTRAGMGMCQGRFCSVHVARLVTDETGISRELLVPPRPRPPVVPIPLWALAEMDAGDRP